MTRCRICDLAMTAVEPGQTSHPGCDHNPKLAKALAFIQRWNQAMRARDEHARAGP